MQTSQFFQLPEQKKQEILEKSFGVFSQEIFDKVSIRKISDTLNISTGGFYNYFSSKDDLYLYLIDWKLSQQYNCIINKATGEVDDSEQSRHFWELFHKSSAEIRKQYYFRIKNNVLFSVQQAQLNHLTSIDEKTKTAISFLFTVLPFVMRELSDVTGDPTFDGDYWMTIKDIILSGVYHSGNPS